MRVGNTCIEISSIALPFVVDPNSVDADMGGDGSSQPKHTEKDLEFHVHVGEA